MHVTSPHHDVAPGVATPSQEAHLVQSLRTYRLDPKTGWSPAPQQFAWTGALAAGRQLRVVVPPDACPTAVLQTAAGDVVHVPSTPVDERGTSGR